MQLIFKTLKDFKTFAAAEDLSQTLKSRPLHETKSSQSGLNYRQIEVLADPPESPLSASEYGKLWKVTRMTSLSDLTALCEQGLATKSGHGKATRYHIHT